ncbi:YidH family protein [Streptomyces sp. NPDC057699]|uniref:YidH family protein n=1 Tax=Streptomyces sp. NPDC057699 TaxID=3346220 RepID=UPI00367C341C
MPDKDAPGDRNAPADTGSSPVDAGRSEVEGPGLRNTLANERTLLAWFRTALALLAASFAVVKLTDSTPRELRLALGSYLVVLAIGIIVAGYAQWHGRHVRIRGSLPLDRGLSALALTVALFLLAGFVVAVIILAP